MPRANRHYLPGHIWHITHRCHKREFLLKFAKDKQLWVYWLFEARKRFGLSVLNYVVTSNHIHLLVYENEDNVISKSIQLVAGRVGQEFNMRKRRKGAFWEDRYHATAVQRGDHFVRCLAYIDLNMVRAGVVSHPCEWGFGGYVEIQGSKERYAIIDRDRLMSLLAIDSEEVLRAYHRQWVDEVMKTRVKGRDSKWTESVAVGDEEFVQDVQRRLGARVKGRSVTQDKDGFKLMESQASYGDFFRPEKGVLRLENRYFWDV